MGQAIPCIRAVSLRFKTSYTAPGLTIWIQFKIIKWGVKQFNSVMWVIVLWKWGYSMPDDIDGGVVEYNWIFLPPNSQYGYG